MTRIYVGNLSYHTTEDTLGDMFAQYGTVDEVAIVIDRMTGRSRGFAFVQMNSPQEAQAAIDGLHGQDFEGRKLTVNEARPREEMGGGGGGRGPRGGGGGGGRGGPRGGGGGGGGRPPRW